MELYEKYLSEVKFDMNKYLRRSTMEQGRIGGEDIWTVTSPDNMILMEIYDFGLAKLIQRTYGIK